MSRRNQNKQTPDPRPLKTDNSESPLIKIAIAFIGALALIVVALINQSTAVIPIEATQTAEARLTAIVMASQVYLNQITGTPVPSVTPSMTPTETGTPTPSQAPSITPTEIKPISYEYKVEVGDTLKSISKKYLILDSYANAIGRANCNQSPVEGDVLIIKYLYVQLGDTIDLIAKKFGASPNFIRSINNLSQEVVFPPVGQILILPGRCGSQ